MSSVWKKFMIGPSTGWLYARGISSLKDQEIIIGRAGANALEIPLLKFTKKDKRIISLKKGKMFDAKTFPYCSLEIPPFNGRNPERQISLAEEVISYCKAKAVTIHPIKIKGKYPTEYYENMISRGVPLAIENMDSRKDSGFEIEELEMLVKDMGCGFVFDVQHAYEHDQEMVYAEDLLKSLKNRITHLHVSGETKENIHSLVYKARNTEKIVEFIRRILGTRNVPLILEGEYKNYFELKKEIEFLTEALGPR